MKPSSAAGFALLTRAALHRVLRAAAMFGVIVALATVFEARAAGPAKPTAVATISILADFVSAVRDGRAPLVDGAAGRRALMLADRIATTMESLGTAG